MFFLQPNPSWHYLLYFHYVIDYPNCQYLDSLFLVNHILLHFHLDCLCAVAIDHQILHSSDPGFLQSLQKGHPTGIGLPLAELEPDGLDGMIAIQRGSNLNLPPIPIVPTVDEEHGSTLLEVLDSILQHAEGDEHLGSDCVSLHLFQMSPQYSRFMMENCPFVIGMYGHVLFSAAIESQILLMLSFPLRDLRAWKPPTILHFRCQPSGCLQNTSPLLPRHLEGWN